jgi:hypothetical protein
MLLNKSVTLYAVKRGCVSNLLRQEGYCHLGFLKMDSKSKGDISEQGVTFQLLKLGWNVLKPIGDRLPYDLVVERGNKFIKIQVKTAYVENETTHCINVRMVKTNRKEYKYVFYKESDFNFAVCYVPELENYYVFPVEYFLKYKSSIRITKRNTHADYKNNWQLIENYIAG